jgi:RecA-family ATPase
MQAFVPASAYLDLPREPQPWVVDKLIPVGGLVNVFGKPKSGKSFLMLGVIEAIANRLPEWEGFAIKKHGAIAYLQVDTPREEWAARVTRMSWTSPEAADNIWIADMWQVPEFPFNILNPQGTEMQWLRDNLAKIQPVLVVIDTLREIHGGDENDSTVMRNVIANLVAACRPAAIVLVSHSRKDSVMTSMGEDDLMDQQRGSSYVSGRMDVIIKVSPKRLTFKGRATGQQQYPISQDERGFIHVNREDTDNFEDAFRIASQRAPDASDNQLAEDVARIAGISHSTAYRRVKQKRRADRPEPIGRRPD